MKNFDFKKIAVGVSTLFLPLLTAHAAPLSIPSAPTPPKVDTFDELLLVVKNVLGYVYSIFFIIATVMILWAAFTYLSAGGDPKKVDEAKHRIIYATVAIVVALLAVGFTSIVASIVK